MPLETILHLISTYGSAFVIAGLAIAMVYRFFSLQITLKEKQAEAELEKHKPQPVHGHFVFANIDQWMAFNFHQLPINDPGRKQVFEDLLRIYFAQFATHLREFVMLDYQRMSAEEFGKAAYFQFLDIMRDAKAKAGSQGIPVAVLEKFMKWNQPFMTTMGLRIQELARSQFHLSNYTTLIAVLDAYNWMLSDLVLSAEHTLKELNGDLDGVVYRGIACGPNH